MRKIFFSSVVVMLIGCELPPPDIECPLTRSHQTGTFEARTRHLGGGCGSMGSLKLKIQGGVVLQDNGAGCEKRFVEWDKYSCTTQSNFECDDGIWKMNLDWFITSTPEDENKINGRLVTYMEKWYGWSCTSEYSFEAYKVEGTFQKVVDKIKKF